MAEPLVCTPKRLPKPQQYAAALKAIEVNPMNHAPVERLAGLGISMAPRRDYISALTAKYWKTNGVRLTVSFMDNPSQALRRRILQHMNAWSKTGDIRFVETKGQGQVRIARESGQDGGYWSYLGTDVLLIDPNRQTMNLEGFTMQTPDSEFYRVVRHETGHTLGFPHEHMRKDLVAKIDPQKAIAYFGATQGWTEEEVRHQVLTPLEEASLIGTAASDQNSIMCYQIPGALTKNGQPILGGLDIDEIDYAFVGKLYPKKAKPKPKAAP
jgi:hypothetical protein